ncbi:MAG: hypothetical protein NTY53_03620 [Kiritimatiellaeota bacterium]|nr:hypothetical protein [Kiritimatiellota bacterium]
MRAIRPIGLSALLALASLASETNLLQNGDFSRQTEGWSLGAGQKISVDRDVPPGIAGQSLRIELVKDGGSSYGQIYQNVKAKPHTLYRLEGQTRSTKAGFAFLSLKLRRDGHELERIAVPAKSQTSWAATTHEFSSADANEIQVLCRWEQSASRGWLGQAGWFAGLKLVELGSAPPPPPELAAIAQAAAIKPLAPPPLPLKPGDADLFVTPTGAGQRDGSSWENALPGNAPGVLQAAWDALAPGRTCRVGSGVYAGVGLAIASGGSGPDKMKRLAGEDTGQGLPWLVGTWNPAKPEGGSTFISLKSEVAHCAFENLRLARYQFSFFSQKGRHVGLRIRNCHLHEFRYGIFLCGLAYTDQPELASHDIEIADCQFIHFTKNAVRLQGGNYDVRVINCVADAGGKDWMKEAFQICYDLAGDSPRRQSHKDPKTWAGEHDILFINCVARNAIYGKSRYWQGDGFCAENDVRNLAFVNCSSFDNADGGWDVKARNVIYVNCISLRNKMNWRIWNHAFMFNCLSAYSFKRGGSWITAGLWSIGDVHAAHCTFHNNSSQQFAADKKGDAEAKIALQQCLVSCDGTNAQAEKLYTDEARVTRTATSEWLGTTGADLHYVAAATSKSWTGEPPDAFDSRNCGPAQGYHSSVSAAWRSQSTEQLIRAARALLKHNGWEDFTNQAARVVQPPK